VCLANVLGMRRCGETCEEQTGASNFTCKRTGDERVMVLDHGKLSTWERKRASKYRTGSYAQPSELVRRDG